MKKRRIFILPDKYILACKNKTPLISNKSQFTKILQLKNQYKFYMENLFFCFIALFFCNCTVDKNPFNYNDTLNHNKILFTSNRSGKDQLYTMDPDGSDIRQITSGKWWHNNGKWSPDGQRIVCNTEEGVTTAGFPMVVMNADGSNRKLLGYGTQMTWYPDGNMILFIYAHLEIKWFDVTLYGINPNGTDMVVLSKEYAGQHSISSDGTKIVFSKELNSENRIVILNYPEFDNSNYLNVTGAIHPVFSPLNTKLAFSMNNGATNLNDICEINIDGSNFKKITNNSSTMTYVYPEWSPDGRRIAFLALCKNSPQIWNLYMVDQDGTNLHKIIDDNSVKSCDWAK